MAGKTPRFGLNQFGAGTPGTIVDDGQKYTSLDRLTIDRLLSQVEQHTHRYQPPGDAIDGAPTGVLGTDGTLSGGYTYYYRFSVMDEFGNESPASPELTVVTPAPLDAPGAPDLSNNDDPGALEPGYYYYGLTAHRDQEESTLSQATMVSLLAGETSVIVTLPEYGDAESFSVWRMGPSESGYTRIGLISSPDETWLDDGSVPADPCACDPGVAPPDYNTGISSYSVTVTLPLDYDLGTARSWRLYRTIYAGIYNSPAMVHEVVEHEDEWDDTSPLMRMWVDTGDDMSVGKPMDIDQNMRFNPLSFESVETLPDPVGYPEGYPIVADGSLYYIVNGLWVPVGGTGGGGGSGTGGLSGTLTSPNGLRFSLSVDNTGALVTTTTAFPGPPSPPLNLRVV